MLIVLEWQFVGFEKCSRVMHTFLFALCNYRNLASELEQYFSSPVMLAFYNTSKAAMSTNLLQYTTEKRLRELRDLHDPLH